MTFEAWIKPDHVNEKGQMLFQINEEGSGVMLTCSGENGDNW